jgi:hypothetical protein
MVFGLLTVVHIWRVLAEGTYLARDPFFVLITIAAAALYVSGVASCSGPVAREQ